MLRALTIIAALGFTGCAVHRAKADAHRAWIDVTLDDPMQPERVLAFLDAYDPMRVGERFVDPPTVGDARAWLDAYRTDARHWIDEVVQANDHFEPGELSQATLGELAGQLVGVMLQMGPMRADQPVWPEEANPYPWPDDSELRGALFGLYLQTGRLCMDASRPIPGCEVEGVNLGWAMAAELLNQHPDLAQRVSRPAEREALASQGWAP